jgi:hypothetical protein
MVIYSMPRYEVRVTKSTRKNIEKAPELVRDKFTALMLDLESRGPVQPMWPNYSKLGAGEYHCHLARKWVACWRAEKASVIVEVYYAGSREDAPY